MTAKPLFAAALCAAIFAADPAAAYIGESFVSVPGVAGGWKGELYKDWVRVESHEWKTKPAELRLMRRKKLFISGPFAPRQGASSIALSVDKRSPAMAALLDKCASKAPIAEIAYAESSEDARSIGEYGKRPAEVPAYYEYKLKDVTIGCPAVAGAPEQAFILDFNDIEWVNYKGEGDGVELALETNVLPPLKMSGATKSFVITYYGVAHDVADDQCPAMNVKPTEDDFYRLMSPADAAKERAQNATRGGVNYDNGQMSLRGPNQLNVCHLPGLVPDQGHIAPKTTVARGLDLDGNDGTGAPAAGTCKHTNFAATDGRKGIDNQLFTVQGCIPGYMGHKGFMMQYANEQRRNARTAGLIEINGIDNEQNDDSVMVTVLASKDPMQKSASGAEILHDYTFRLTENIESTAFFARFPGKIVNGAVITDQVSEMQIKMGERGAPETFYNAAIRIEIMPDGAMKGVIAGYQKWREIYSGIALADKEGLYGLHCPAMYQAFKRAADGLKNPTTGECDGISVAHDIEGVPAFIPPTQRKSLVAQAQ